MEERSTAFLLVMTEATSGGEKTRLTGKWSPLSSGLKGHGLRVTAEQLLYDGMLRAEKLACWKSCSAVEHMFSELNWCVL